MKVREVCEGWEDLLLLKNGDRDENQFADFFLLLLLMKGGVYLLRTGASYHTFIVCPHCVRGRKDIFVISLSSDGRKGIFVSSSQNLLSQTATPSNY